MLARRTPLKAKKHIARTGPIKPKSKKPKETDPNYRFQVI